MANFRIATNRPEEEKKRILSVSIENANFHQRGGLHGALNGLTYSGCGQYPHAAMKKLLATVCLILSTTCLAQSPNAKILVLEREQGEKRVRRPREKMPNPTSEFILKVTPQNSGSQHLVLGTETIPPGGVIPKHRHLEQDEILFLQNGSARVTLNDQDYEVHAGGMVFFPLNTWVSLRNTGAEPIQLIFIFSAPGFDGYMRCSSVPQGQPAPPIPLDEVSKCAHQGHVEYEILADPKNQ
jgi:quercetin dioxygenase-like cupin family protein